MKKPQMTTSFKTVFTCCKAYSHFTPALCWRVIEDALKVFQSKAFS